MNLKTHGPVTLMTLWLATLLLVTLLLGVSAEQAPAQTIYGFDDGTFQGWQYVDANGDPFDNTTGGVGWVVSIEDIQIDTGPGGEPWYLLQGSTVDGPGEPGVNNHPSSPTGAGRSNNYRVIPDPWASRDGTSGDLTPMLISPTFVMNGPGGISVDMFGGQASGGDAAPADESLLPQSPADLPFEAVGSSADGAWHGYALYDVADDAYIAWGFSDINNDGEVPADSPGRSAWQTVEITEEELAPYKGDGKEYQLHIFDSDIGGWGWIGFDTVVLPTTFGVPGDVNGDGVTDRDDFDIISANYGMDPATFEEGDIVDPPSGVGLEDFRFWKRNVGATAGAAAGAEVPEPATLSIAAVAVAASWGLLKQGRRRRRSPVGSAAG
ncbi:MAG: hypothetical protein AAF961_14195 [Planctomycetota bacterium]